MYNDGLKRRFVSETTDLEARRKMALYFDAIESFERAYSKDIYAFSVEEVEDVVAGFGSARTSSSTSGILRTIKRYVAWCSSHGVEGTSDAAYHACVNQPANMRVSMVASPKHLSDVLGVLFHQPSMHSTDDVVAAYVWMAFSGLPEDATILLTSDDFSVEHKIISFNGIEYPLYDESLSIFSSCIESDSFASVSERCKVVKPRVHGSLVLRSISGKPNLPTLRTKLARKVGGMIESGLNVPTISYSRVWLSGVFYRLFEREKSGAAIDLLSDTPEEITRQISQSKAQMTTRYRNHCIRQYESDYLAWKQAFYPNTP